MRSVDPSFHLVDPEPLGVLIRRVTPVRWRADDFQDYRAWRWLTAMVLIGAVSVGTRRLVVPMTIVDPASRAAIFDRLAHHGIQVNEFWLHADAGTLAARVRARDGRAGSWAEQQIERCLAFPVREAGAVPIDATRSAEEVRDAIIAALAKPGPH